MGIFGIDLWCDGDLTPDMAEVSDDATILGQALLRRFSTPEGWLLDEPGYGLDLRDELGETLTPARQAALRGKIQLQALRDERVLSCSVVASFSAGVLTVGLSGRASFGPFRLTIAVSAASVQLLEAA